jgi:uncharacterized protein DUF4922
VSWAERLLDSLRAGDDLRGPVSRMLEQQRRTWPLLAAGEASFAKVVSRQIEDGGSRVIVQSNPGRRVSTSAKVDPGSIALRPCFLCEQNLPAEERGVAFGDELVIFANPFPIVGDHLSIVSRAHVPQRIAGRVGEMLALARALGPKMLVLYNGPACGASAPDHLHFQAGRSGLLPIADDLARLSAGKKRRVSLETFGRRTLVFRGKDERELALEIERAIDGAARAVGESEAVGSPLGRGAKASSDQGPVRPVEPMINIVATFGGELTVYLFPRQKHRPARFFATGDDQILWSPGALDMAGIAVIAHPDHFDRVTSGVARAVYEEVSLSSESFRRWTEVL